MTFVLMSTILINSITKAVTTIRLTHSKLSDIT